METTTKIVVGAGTIITGGIIGIVLSLGGSAVAESNLQKIDADHVRVTEEVIVEQSAAQKDLDDLTLAIGFYSDTCEAKIVKMNERKDALQAIVDVK